ncbi:MAG: ABC transporter ATP-binding protein [Gammaproteobacteria bacterium]|nr:ABC transporter ATP-binding protein [Gammaproteobacteria bacterium]
MTAPVLAMDGVRKAFGSGRARVEALRGVDLVISAGEFVMVTGPSGSGKSTLLHLSALLDAPSGGRVAFMGKDLSRSGERALSLARARAVGIVFQRYALLPRRSVLENVMFRFRYTDCARGEAERLAREALARVGIDALSERPARVLSGGEMQRVAIARAIAARPRLLVADEPTGNLDRKAAGRVMEVFGRLHKDGMTIVMATHNLDLLRHASRRLELVDGAIADPDARPC